MVHRRPRLPEVVRDHLAGARDGLHRGHGLRRLLDRRLRAHPGVRHGRAPRPVHVPGDPVEDRAAGRADVLRHRSNPDGTTFDGDPRAVLKRQLARAADELGFSFYVGPELEYFYFKSATDRRSSIRAATSTRPRSTSPPDYRKRTVQYLESMGIPVEYVHHEVAPSQHEIDLRYTDALSMADSVMTYRLTVKEVAHEFGIYATFMPKPVAGRERLAGCTPTSRCSRATATRSSTPPTSTTSRRWRRPTSPASSGTRREITLLSNQWVNSYKRLVPGYEAPVYVCWARRNRSRPRPGADVQAEQGEARRGSSSAPPTPPATPTSRSPAMLAAGLAGLEGEYELPPGGLEQHLRDDRARAGGRRASSLSRRTCSRRSSSRRARSVLRDTLGDHVSWSSCCATSGRNGTPTSPT